MLESGGDFRCAAYGRSCSDRVPPEAAVSLCSVGAEVSSGATTERLSCARGERDLHSMPMQRCSKAGRPWKAPLPPWRSVQVRSLGDLWVEDRRPGGGKSRARLTEWLEEEVGVLPPGASPEAVMTAALRCDPVSNFKNEIKVTSQACGLVSRTGVGRKLAHGTFRFTVGLGSLFFGSRQTGSHSQPPYASPIAREQQVGGARFAYGGLATWGSKGVDRRRAKGGGQPRRV
jgi:hypothetical protein